MSTSAPRVLRSRTGQFLEGAASSDNTSARARRWLKNKSGSIQKPAHPPARSRASTAPPAAHRTPRQSPAPTQPSAEAVIGEAAAPPWFCCQPKLCARGPDARAAGHDQPWAGPTTRATRRPAPRTSRGPRQQTHDRPCQSAHLRQPGEPHLPAAPHKPTWQQSERRKETRRRPNKSGRSPSPWRAVCGPWRRRTGPSSC